MPFPPERNRGGWEKFHVRGKEYTRWALALVSKSKDLALGSHVPRAQELAPEGSNWKAL